MFLYGHLLVPEGIFLFLGEEITILAFFRIFFANTSKLRDSFSLPDEIGLLSLLLSFVVNFSSPKEVAMICLMFLAALISIILMLGLSCLTIFLCMENLWFIAIICFLLCNLPMFL